ncbi:MAG TPA: hypothetical protein VHR16_02520 [Candidatus Limnocylindrales bacterium]|nr:hypothetical protein [Candidatus Limnocylindrales bacterium]
MSTRRLALGLGPPVSRMTAVILLLAAALSGCYGAGATASSEDSTTLGPGISTASGGPRAALQRAGALTGVTWLAEGPRGWEAGQIGGGRVALARAEVGIAASDGWILSAVLRPIGSTRLLIRDGPAADAKAVDLASLAPTATVIVGDRAYVSGFAFANARDPGIVEVDLDAATSRVILPPSGAGGTRSLAASPDGSTLVSSLCDFASDPEPETCSLTVVPLDGAAPRSLGKVAGGFLRGTSSTVAVVAPQGAEPPTWIAGIDLATGRELWRLTAEEFGPSVMTRDHGLIQQRLRIDGPKPSLVIDAIDLRTGTSRSLYEETASAPRVLWPALCSETNIAIGEDATGSRALAASDDGRTAVRLVPIDGGNPVDVQLALRSEP